MNKYKFRISKLDRLNKTLRKKPYKYIYKEMMPKKLFNKIQNKTYFKTQKMVGEDWDRVLKEYFTNKIETEQIKPKKTFNNEKIIWQFWGQGWDFEKLPDVVKISYKSVEKYKKDYEIIHLDMNNINDYLEIPAYILKKVENKKMGFAHFTDIIRLALLYNYGGVWIDATILLTDYLPQEYFEMDYFMFQRDDNLENKKDWEDYDDFYFSWNNEMKVRVLNSIIFAKKNNEIIKTLLDMLLIFWEHNDLVPNYFFFQVLYTELIENYYKKKQCKIVSDTLTHELIRVWFDKFSQEKLDEITKRNNVHKLTYKIDSGKRDTKGTFLDYFKKMYDIK
ncbi:capsular polysaccharide synthesis protein [Leptotrichia buccalis]|uniref:Capsular polysaccharide synthesis n=1 Tax=Leptotrichia buccalis (strain ATCC 14201 / DSM 1135 / JCM 12969 / NCTC 10249 / C-1013-b) TaxID=523794 RepID=C7NDZ8_LEPBD|nr:capsular polysaccharide synthesis protein [Leptotrichia buccalis]ACV40112.1 Capsular polysaccharide synthesis [Leptotrichia buccalis C-1013-b]